MGWLDSIRRRLQGRSGPSEEERALEQELAPDEPAPATPQQRGQELDEELADERTPPRTGSG